MWLIGNKIDMGEEKVVVENSEALRKAKELNMEFIELSAKTGENMAKLEEGILEYAKSHKTEDRKKKKKTKKEKVPLNEEPAQGGSGCC